MDTTTPMNIYKPPEPESVPLPQQVVVPDIPSIETLLGNQYGPVLREWFPDVDPPVYPTGTNILVQLRIEKKQKTIQGGQTIYFPDETVDANKARAQTGIVRALGPSAYRHRVTLQLWPEGHWCVPGMFVRLPMYGGDRLQFDYQRVEKDHRGIDATVTDFVLFATFKDQDCLGIIRVDPGLLKNG